MTMKMHPMIVAVIRPLPKDVNWKLLNITFLGPDADLALGRK